MLLCNYTNAENRTLYIVSVDKDKYWNGMYGIEAYKPYS